MAESTENPQIVNVKEDQALVTVIVTVVVIVTTCATAETEIPAQDVAEVEAARGHAGIAIDVTTVIVTDVTIVIAKSTEAENTIVHEVKTTEVEAEAAIEKEVEVVKDEKDATAVTTTLKVNIETDQEVDSYSYFFFICLFALFFFSFLDTFINVYMFHISLNKAVFTRYLASFAEVLRDVTSSRNVSEKRCVTTLRAFA